MDDVMFNTNFLEGDLDKFKGTISLKDFWRGIVCKNKINSS